MKLLRRFWALVLGLVRYITDGPFKKGAKPPPVKSLPAQIDKHPWNAPTHRMVRHYKWSDRPSGAQPRMPKRERCRRWRWLKRMSGYGRRDMGAIGAGHMKITVDYSSAKAYLGL